MSCYTDKTQLIQFLVVLALLLILALFITPVSWSFIAIIHVFAFTLQLIVEICTASVEILLLIARGVLKAGSSCTDTNGYRDIMRNIKGAQLHFVLTIGVGFGAHRFYSLVEERPKFRLQLYIPDKPEIMQRCERSEIRLKTQSQPIYIRYRPHVPSSLGPNYIKEWKELIDFYLSKRYATEISDEPKLTTTKVGIANHRASGKTCLNEKGDLQVGSRGVKELDPLEFPGLNESKNKLVQRMRTGLSPQETLNAARAQLKYRLRRHKKWRHS